MDIPYSVISVIEYCRQDESPVFPGFLPFADSPKKKQS